MVEKGSGNGKKDQQKKKVQQQQQKNEKSNQESKKVQNDKNHESKKIQNDKSHETKKLQNDKKKVQANGLKANSRVSSAPAPKKKKTTKKPTSKGKSDSFLSQLFRLLIIQAGILWVLYIVDYQKFNQIRSGAAYLFNATVSVLPPDVVAKGRETFEYVRAPAQVALDKAASIANDASTFLNTNPLVKDHWAIVRDISLIFSARLADYMRTVYLQITGYFVDFKNKIFP